MDTPEDAIERAQHFRDAPKDCLVELAPGSYVVTTTAEEAERLHAHLGASELVQVSLGDGLTIHTTEPDVVTRVVDSLRDELARTHEALLAAQALTAEVPAPPVKRGPGRPRKAVN